MDRCASLKLSGVDGQPGKDPAEAGVAAGDVGVRAYSGVLAQWVGDRSGPPAVVNVEHKGIGALNEDLVVAVLGLLHVLDGVDNVRGELRAVLLEAGNLLLDVVLEQVAEALLVARGKLAQLALKQLLVEDLVDANTAPLRHTKSAHVPQSDARFVDGYRTPAFVL
jgi:hypothetical protein